MKTTHLLSLCILLLLLCGAGLSADDSETALAVFPFENLNRDPEQEYLSGLITSLIRKDLSRTEGIVLVDRQNLEEVLQEQKLQFTGVLDEKSAVETGRIVGATYIIKGGYVFLGEDLFLNLDLIDTETGRSISFSERGYQENTVHALIEQLILYLTDEEITIQSPAGEKTIIAVRQQEPGKVMLYSPIIDARVYLDGKFLTYTTGDSTIPLEIPVDPGKHIIRVHLSGDFGVIHLPEVRFSDWHKEFELAPGEVLVLEDETALFNHSLYNLSELIWKRLYLESEDEDTKSIDHSILFTDRQGVERALDLRITIYRTEEGARAAVDLDYLGKRESYELICTKEKGEIEEKYPLELLELKLDLDCRYNNRIELLYRVKRSDIYQGLHRKEEHMKPWDGSEP